MFTGSEGGKAMAITYTLIATAIFNHVDTQALLTRLLAQIADHKATRLVDLIAWCYAFMAA